MPNTNSKLAAAEDKHEDKERIQKLENEIVRLQRSYEDLLKKYNAAKDQLNQLQQRGKFYNINNLLQNTIQRTITIIILIPCSIFLLTV